MNEKLETLVARLGEINDLGSAAAVLHWDQATHMPSGGATGRGRQIATLSRLAHEKFTAPEIGELIEDLKPYEEPLPPDSDEARLLRVVRRDYEKAVKVPADFKFEFSQHTARTFETWKKARPANEFASVAPLLERTVELSRQYAGFFPGHEHIADPLIDVADEGMTVAKIAPLFEELRAGLVPMVQAIAEQPEADDACLRSVFPKEEQIAFAAEVSKRFGYDFERGRMDKTAHPFETRFCSGDVRITYRTNERFLGEGLFSILHETGHAMYEQGVSPGLDRTPLGHGTSAGVHESQSRLWENAVGRSRGFWKYLYPILQEAFPGQLGGVSEDVFYRAINKVKRSLIRTDADEVTYNLHVIIRFGLELDLLEGRLAVRDLPDAWRERYRSDIGVASPDDRNGVLQDVHWFIHHVGGAFQCYTLGNILTAQFFRKALEIHPEISSEMERGEFSTLRSWLTENIYQHGRKFPANELVQRVIGAPMSVTPFLDYLRNKFGELYTL